MTTNPYTQEDGLSTVFKVVCLNKEQDIAGWGSAVLVDGLRNIFATCAHVARGCGALSKTEHYIYLPQAERHLRAEHHKNWVNWNTDTAWLRIDHDLPPCAATPLGACHPAQESAITIKGYPEIKSAKPVIRKGLVLFPDSHYGITIPSMNEKKEAQSQLYVPRDERRFLYEHYIVVSMPDKKDRIAPGMSGSALFDERKNLAGILSAGVSSGSYGLAVPARELAFPHAPEPSARFSGRRSSFAGILRIFQKPEI